MRSILMLFALSIGLEVHAEEPCHCDEILKEGVFKEAKCTSEAQYRKFLWELVTADDDSYGKRMRQGTGMGDIPLPIEDVSIGVDASAGSFRQEVDRLRSQFKSGALANQSQIDLTNYYYKVASQPVIDAWRECIAKCNRERNLHAESLTVTSQILNSVSAKLRLAWHQPRDVELPIITITSIDASNVDSDTIKTLKNLVNQSIGNPAREISIRRLRSWEPVHVVIDTDKAGRAVHSIAAIEPSRDETARYIRFLIDAFATPNPKNNVAVTDGVFEDKIRVMWRWNPDHHAVGIYRTEKNPFQPGFSRSKDFTQVFISKFDRFWDDTHVVKGKPYWYAIDGVYKSQVRENEDMFLEPFGVMGRTYVPDRQR